MSTRRRLMMQSGGGGTNKYAISAYFSDGKMAITYSDRPYSWKGSLEYMQDGPQKIIDPYCPNVEFDAIYPVLFFFDNTKDIVFYSKLSCYKIYLGEMLLPQTSFHSSYSRLIEFGVFGGGCSIAIIYNARNTLREIRLYDALYLTKLEVSGYANLDVLEIKNCPNIRNITLPNLNVDKIKLLAFVNELPFADGGIFKTGTSIDSDIVQILNNKGWVVE